VCDTLQPCRPLFFGWFPNPPRRKKELRVPKKMLGIPLVHEPQNLENALDYFQDDWATVRRLGNWGWSKKSTENKLVNRNSDKQIESVTFGLWPIFFLNNTYMYVYKYMCEYICLCIFIQIYIYICIYMYLLFLFFSNSLLGSTRITQTPNGCTIIWKSPTSHRAISRFWGSWQTTIFCEVVEGGREEYSHGWPLRKQRFQQSTSFLS